MSTSVTSNALLLISGTDCTGGCVRINRNFQLIQSQIDSLKSSSTTSTASSATLSVYFAGGNGFTGSLYSASLVASGGTPPYTYAIIGSLPPGLTLNTASGNITGTPSATGVYSFAGQVTDSTGTSVSVPASINVMATGSSPLVVYATTLASSTTTISVSAPTGVEVLLVVQITQSSGGGDQITWGGTFVPPPPVNLNLDANAQSVFNFAAIGGNWRFTGMAL